MSTPPFSGRWIGELTKSLELFALPPPILCRSSMLSSKLRIGSILIGGDADFMGEGDGD